MRRPNHSFPGALAVGVFLAAVALICAVMIGVAGTPMPGAGTNQAGRF